MHRILVIVPYYGAYPPLMPLWLKSCAANPTVDWLIVSDKPPEQPLPPNVRFQRMTLEDLWRRAVERLYPETAYPTPYKLCDWRPMFGVLFAEEVEGYDFWGHCDLDVVFGQIRQFLTDEVLESHDKIFWQGCFSLTRNSECMNSLFRQPGSVHDWRDVLGDPVNRVYDEKRGILAIAKANGIRCFLKHLVIDIDPRHRTFKFTHRLRHLNKPCQAFAWHDGKVIHRYASANRLICDEYCMIHMQKRRFSASPESANVAALVFEPLKCAPCVSEELPTSLTWREWLADLMWTAAFHLGRPMRRVRRWRREKQSRIDWQSFKGKTKAQSL